MEPSQTESAPKLAYVQRDKDRYGIIRYYLRMPGRPKQRIHETYGTPAFERAYWRARKGLIEKRRPKRGRASPRITGEARKGHVYFVDAPGHNRIKIGFSHDPFSRLKDLQVGSPVKLALIFSVTNGDEHLEAALHKHFAEYRVVGEWFVAEPVRSFIKDLKLHRYDALVERGIQWTRPTDA